LIVAIPWAAARGKFHIPGYGAMAILAFTCGLLLGRISGARGITGTVAGFAFAVIFSLLIAAAAGCLLALFSYRPPSEY
jgi:hypothetical protein